MAATRARACQRHASPSNVLVSRTSARSPSGKSCPTPLETLENRLLLAVVAQVNFQTAPPTPPTPAGYVPDSGLAYGDRQNGFSYGWWSAPLVGGVPTNPAPANNPSARNRLGGVSGQTPGLIYNTMVHF